ncbi:ABC-type branched-subunit amino acid transport system substrate-binding protein [Natronocella acetinitrilica]|jgi:branched-chain amino acid transport system substrate-binding protein|uniref:ABC-type branched-subunit amino acid transport system substrate-binding protein n=1 Tax=Natronocella acetinitrilica TaxID=414046 RepID=A0AAE3G5S1_9GAMM|nr:ABC transporter substrate-binding protein [Natronocella acetinitrilica]MCP1675236.1 ABC-type branched-subunit amino acid transport system substrate-binding protein [Natronocella acetinitrilica]
MTRRRLRLSAVMAGLLVALAGCQSSSEPGVTSDTIVLGSVLALEGPAQGLGQGMRTGIRAATRGRSVQGRDVVVRFLDDSYAPAKAQESTNRLVNSDEGIFLMLGNVGTPTAVMTLPILAEHYIPAVGFFTGAGILRPGSGGPILNYRASYVEEVGAVVDEAIRRGFGPDEVCAYVQNDAYGMAGIVGMREAMLRHDASQNLIDLYNEILSRGGDEPVRNNIGPVGVYPRNTAEVREGYQSLKSWEQRTGTSCQVVVTVGAYENIAHFIRYARRHEAWVISAVSFTGAENFHDDLRRHGIDSGVLMTQVVPNLDSRLPIVEEARQALGSEFGYVSLEGYVVGRMVLRLLEDMDGDLTRENFMAHARQARFDLGGIEIDFTRDGNQASQLVNLNSLTRVGWAPTPDTFWDEHVVSR